MRQQDHPVGSAIWGVGLRPLDCWDRGFEFWRGCMDIRLLCFFMFCLGSGLCDGADHLYRGILPIVMCVCACVWCVCLIVWEVETSTKWRPLSSLGSCKHSDTHRQIFNELLWNGAVNPLYMKFSDTVTLPSSTLLRNSVSNPWNNTSVQASDFVTGTRK